MPVGSLLVGGFGAKIFQFANGFLFSGLSLHHEAPWDHSLIELSGFECLPTTAATAATATAMPFDSLLVRGFGAQVLEFANGFPGFDLSFHRYGSLKNHCD